MTDRPAKTEGGGKMTSQEYVTLALCILVPIVGLLFAVQAKSQRERWADRALTVGAVSLVVWIALILVV